MAVFKTKQMRFNLWPLSVIGEESLESIWASLFHLLRAFLVIGCCHHSYCQNCGLLCCTIVC